MVMEAIGTDTTTVTGMDTGMVIMGMDTTPHMVLQAVTMVQGEL
jgi:hypothetical protein